MSILASLLTIIYCTLTLWLWYYWKKIKLFGSVPGEQASNKVSIVIPVRDEAATIGSLLADLDGQVQSDKTLYNPEQMEVIVVDDCSQDNTRAIVNLYDAKNYSLELLDLDLPHGFVGSHKKMALSQAIEIAKGEIIVTTDGDCRAGPHWISTVLSFIKNNNAVFVSAPVVYKRSKYLFKQLQAIEFASLIGAGGACLQARLPNMCSGANLAFTKKAYEEVGGYQDNLHIPSGDDEFLLQKISKRFPGKAHYLKSKEAIVQTDALPTLLSFYHQRKRWAGKWKLHKSLPTALLAIFIFGFHTVLLAIAVLTIVGQFSFLLFAILLLFKAVSEFVYLHEVLRTLDKKLQLTNFILLQLIYSPYAIFFGLAANVGGYRWKSRSYEG